ncbi:hypothetical protein I3760_10G156800 [Carya illinoinensis]|nr:hypothetical protein I3760_10G156800 [Carya illinoinensis]
MYPLRTNVDMSNKAPDVHSLQLEIIAIDSSSPIYNQFPLPPSEAESPVDKDLAGSKRTSQVSFLNTSEI